MKHTHFFPCVLMTLDILAAAAYGCNCEWRKVIYWLAAATLTASVTSRAPGFFPSLRFPG